MSAASFTSAVLRGGRVRLETHPLRPLATGEIDVAVSLAAICGSDLHTVSGRRHAPDGTGLGHEAVGHVIGLGGDTRTADGRAVFVGDRVVFGMISSCGTCDRCTAELAMKCRTLFKYGHAVVDEPPYAVGMLADIVRLRTSVTIAHAPPDLPDEALVSVPCAVSTAVAGIRALGHPRPEEVTVLGAGAVGTYLVAMLADAGVRVTLMEPHAQRRIAAQRWGAELVDVVPDDAPAVIDASGNAAAIGAAIAAAGTGASIVLLGSVSPGREPLTIDPAGIVLGRQHIAGVHNYAPQDVVDGVAWLESRGSSAPHLVSEPFRLTDIGLALDAAFAGDAPRIGVRP